MQLETLILCLNNSYVYTKFPQISTELSNPKHLELSTNIVEVEYSLLPFASLLKASPLLYKFKLKLGYVDVEECSSRELQEVTEKHPNTVVLEKLIIKPFLPSYRGSSPGSKFRETEKSQLATQHAMELCANLPPGVEYVVV